MAANGVLVLGVGVAGVCYVSDGCAHGGKAVCVQQAVIIIPTYAHGRKERRVSCVTDSAFIRSG